MAIPRHHYRSSCHRSDCVCLYDVPPLREVEAAFVGIVHLAAIALSVERINEQCGLKEPADQRG